MKCDHGSECMVSGTHHSHHMYDECYLLVQPNGDIIRINVSGRRESGSQRVKPSPGRVSSPLPPDAAVNPAADITKIGTFFIDGLSLWKRQQKNQ